jgi:hypothetical protein
MSVSPDLIYAETGHGKTSLLATLILWMWRRYGKKSRLYTADNYEILRPFITAGLLEVWNLRETPLKWALDVMRKAARGYWYDPKTQKLVAPTVENTAHVGAHLFEGLNAFSEWQLQYFADRVANDAKGEGMPVGQAADAPFWIAEGEGSDKFKIGGNSRTHYNAIQNEMLRLVTESGKIPNAQRVVWTTLEAKGVDKEDNLPMVGPKIAGSAKTYQVPAWFGNCLYLDFNEATQKRTLKTRPWTEIIAGMKFKHKDKVRKPFVMGMPLDLTDSIPVDYEPDLGKLYEALEAAEARLTEKLRKEVEAKQPVHQSKGA